LQHGTPIETLEEKLINTRFEPCGLTNNSEIPIALSIIDYIFKFIRHWRTSNRHIFIQGDKSLPEISEQEKTVSLKEERGDHFSQSDTPLCTNCGSLTQRSGTCYLCPNCGTTTGCG
jgi:ribonucleoside-diphosphate reductase alpha chain